MGEKIIRKNTKEVRIGNKVIAGADSVHGKY